MINERKFLLASDLHLTDNPLEKYRWNFFPQITKICVDEQITNIIILGDPWDRKDRHSATLVNKTVDSLTDLIEETSCRVDILQGNHDQPLSGVSFFKFLNRLSDIHYHIVPYKLVLNKQHDLSHIWLLPFDKNPLEAWANLELGNANAIFIHQTVAGAMIENDRKITETPNPMPLLPRSLPIFSGDVHRPQRVGGITYVGCPYPVRFGEDWGGRVLIVDGDSFNAPREVSLPTIRRQILDIKDLIELNSLKFKPGDQVRIRFHITTDELTTWPVIELAIKQWAEQVRVNLLNVEAILTQALEKAENTTVGGSIETLTPVEIVKMFATEEKLSADLETVGFNLLATTEMG